MRPRSSIATSLVLCVATTFTAHAQDGAEQRPAEERRLLDESDWTNREAALAYALTDSLRNDFYGPFALTAPLSPDRLAWASASTATRYFAPQGCARGTSEGPTATVVIDHCASGPFGLKGVSGTVFATFGNQDGKFPVKITTLDLMIDGRSVLLTLDGMSVQEVPNRIFTAATTTSGPGRDGSTQQRMSRMRVAWVPGSGCIVTSGRGIVQAGRASYATRVSGYRRCTRQCPSAGTLTVAGPDELTITLDGSATPHVSSQGHLRGTLPIECGASAE